MARVSRLPDALDALLRVPALTPKALAARLKVAPQTGTALLRDLHGTGGGPGGDRAREFPRVRNLKTRAHPPEGAPDRAAIRLTVASDRDRMPPSQPPAVSDQARRRVP